MTRKDFVLIANVLKQNKPLQSERQEAIAIWELIVKDFTRELHSINNMFDESRFIGACNDIQL